MISERQEKLLDFLIKEYITTAEPVSSMALKKVAGLDVSSATVRNDLQALTKEGYIKQPHTSAGRVPTKKAYKHFADKIADSSRYFATSQCCKISIVRQIRFVHEEMEQQMGVIQEIMQTLENDNFFEILNILDKWHKKTMN
jgi:heat-inducible transcriptional repressor